MELIKTSNINEARKLIDRTSKESKKSSLGKTSEKMNKIVVVAQGDEFNRKILENNKVDMLVFSEFKNRKDKLKERDSGLNQVLCKLARDNDIAIGIDFSELIRLNDKNREFEMSFSIARIIQNIKLCKKYEVKVVLVNAEADKKDLMAFMLTLGASTDMAKYAVDNGFEI